MTLEIALLIAGILFSLVLSGWACVIATMPEPEYIRNLRNKKKDE